MKKIIPLIGYYLGWIYPLIVNTYIVLDRYLHIKTKLMGPLDFGNDSIIGYMFYSLIFAAFTFLIYFIYYKEPLKNWGVLVNLPLYFISVYIVPFVFEDHFFPLTMVSLLLSICTIIYTTVVSVDAMKRFD